MSCSSLEFENEADTSSNFMRQQAMSSRMLYGRPIPVARIMQGIADSKFSFISRNHALRRSESVANP